MRKLHRLAILRLGFFTRVLTACLLVALSGRVASDFFHTDGPLTRGAAISAPCNACEIEATAVIGAPAPPALPALPVVITHLIVPPEAHPFAPVLLRAQGRAPPIA